MAGMNVPARIKHQYNNIKCTTLIPTTEIIFLKSYYPIACFRTQINENSSKIESWKSLSKYKYKAVCH